MIKKIYFYVKFCYVQPLHFCISNFYIYFIISFVIRKVMDNEYVIDGHFFDIYIVFSLMFLMSYFIRKAVLSLYCKERYNEFLDVYIKDKVRIKTKTYDKFLMELEIISDSGQKYYEKFVCDILYYETYLKRKLMVRYPINVEVYHSDDKRWHFINTKKMIKDLAGVEKENYERDFLGKRNHRGITFKIEIGLVIIFLLVFCFVYYNLLFVL